MNIKSEEHALYKCEPNNLKEEQILAEAMDILEGRMKKTNIYATDPNVVSDYLKIKIGTKKIEHFYMIHMTSQNEIIHNEILFTGTIDNATVHPREVIRSIMKHNSSSVILAHNHPSGHVEPSEADKQITNRLKTICEIIYVEVIDHIIVSGNQSFSFLRKGLI